MSSPPKPQSQALTSQSSKKPCILYIEENEALFRQIKGSLENAGYGVIGATNSWQALAFLLKSPIRLVLGGQLLCGADGIELIQKIKEAKPDVPVVLWSRTLPNSMRGLDAFVSAEESTANFLTLLQKLLQKYAAA
jgi:DNA-binding NtrC family response regulator